MPTERELLEAAKDAILDALSWMDPETAAQWRADPSYRRLAALIAEGLDEAQHAR